MSGDSRRRARAARIYRWIMRAYPAERRRAFGAQMLQTFRDLYRDTVETGEVGAASFWLGVASDEARSLVWEHLAALSGAITSAITRWGNERFLMRNALPASVAAGVALLALLLGLRVWLYPAVLSAPHGGESAAISVVGVALLALVYAAVALVIMRARADAPTRQRALLRATWLGALAGVCALAAIGGDTVVASDTLSFGLWTLALLAAALAWWLAGVTAARAGGSWRLSGVAALWSGMVTALVAALGEVITTLIALPRLAQLELSNPDYLYWRQPDIQSYAIASALALAMIGLALAPIVAGAIGGAGGWLGARSSRLAPPAA